MKILVLGFAKIKYMPYLDFYLKNIDCEKNDVSVLYWNRDLKKENISYNNVKFYEFCAKQEDDCSKYSKIFNFIKYKKKAASLLKRNFDRVFILHSLPGVLNWRILATKYKNRYVFDFRDLTYEKNHIYRRIIFSLVRNSFFTSVSSDGFRKYLPEDCRLKIFTNHNILFDSLKYRDISLLRRKSFKIRMAFWGYIREENLNRKIIECVAKDERFELHYYGREQKIAKNLKFFAQELNASNVFFHGEYNPEDRYQFVQNTDIIHNIYGESINMKNAMGNKFYDGIIFYLPLICMDGSFMGKMALQNGVGVAVNPYSENFLNVVYSYINSLNEEKFKSCCDALLSHCLNDIHNLKKELVK